MFNETSLREAVIGVWGEHGAHVDVLDELIRRARSAEPVEISTVAVETGEYHADNNMVGVLGIYLRYLEPAGFIVVRKMTR